MTAAEVTAPLVLVKNQAGEIGYHYRGSVIPWLAPEDLSRLEADGMVRALDVTLAPEPAAVATGDGTQYVPRPAKAHAKELWVDYAVSKGWDRAHAESMRKNDLVAALTDGDEDDEDEVPAVDEAAPAATEVPVPAKAGLLEDWQAYARSKGLPDEDIDGKSKQELIELLT
ncbi:MAG: hypothetical protein ACI38R_22745 [Rhodococcus sp. (in: high G+C Gram-positive bacteria)]